ncbi:MAG TPA: ATP-binding protein [Gemmatimonadaceae bacterium]|nr:ATP-binding protein [Gemmatimonadaceae bacterium]
MHPAGTPRRSLGLITLTQALCVLTLIVLLALALVGGTLAVPVAALLLAQTVCALVVFVRTARHSRGTRHALFLGLAAAAVLASAGCGLWTLRVLLPGQHHLLFLGGSIALAGQLAIMLGLATALGRHRHRNWMHFDAVVDAMLLVVAAAIVLVQLGYVPSPNEGVGVVGRLLVAAWNTAAAGNLILVGLLLTWRGDVLEQRVATGLSLGAVALAIASLLAGHALVASSTGVRPVIALLWTITTACWVSAADTGADNAAALRQSGESAAFISRAATIRMSSLVAAILVATGSIVALAFGAGRRPGLGIVLALFAVLLAMRASHALWAQQRATTALERSMLAERELSATLERRVAEGTRDVAEAQRVLQRMWTLGQQIALELQSERVLRCFMDAVIDVARADGGVVGLITEDGRIRIAATTGLGAVLAGTAVPVASSLMNLALRRGTSWCTSDLPSHDLETGSDDADRARLVQAGVHGVAIVPLQRRGDLVGAAMLLSRSPRSFSERELSHIEAMTDLLSIALANADLVETLRQAEWRFRTLFRAAPDAVLTVFESGRVREANDAARDLLGLHPIQLVGRTLEEFAIPEDRERMRAERARALAGESSRIEIRFQHSGGVRIGSLALRRLPEADPPTVLVVGRDITGDREMRARLAETERLAAVGELVAGVAHEVNNPLSTISAYAQLLLRNPALDAETMDAVEVIRSETLRASQVLRDLLTFARRSESEPAPLQLNEVVERTVRLRSYEMSTAGITCTTELAPDLPSVLGDGRQLQQVLLNLMMNAIQAMAPQQGGTLRLTTRADGAQVLLEVSDTGPGVPYEVRAHVFEPFFTTKLDGTGLGLSVSYGIVAAHEGTIIITDTSSEGTTFRVTLPAYHSDAVEAVSIERNGTASAASALKGIRLLFVDDEPTLRSGVRAFGRLRRFAVVTAGDGAAALQAARDQSFDAIVCDLRMPGMDGPAFYEVLRRERPALAERTLFITGDLVSARSRAFLSGTSQPVLSKPFEFEQLEANLLALLRGDVSSNSARMQA